MAKSTKTKKVNKIKAESYDENAELELELDEEVEEDIYEEDFNDEIDEEIEIEEVEEKPKKRNQQSKKQKEYEEDFDDENSLIEDEEFEDAKKTFNREKTDKFMKIFNIFFIFAMIAMIIIAIDVIAIARYNKGPFFAIPMKTYKDGGTKEYYGLGYKVIKYNQIEGRRDTQIGLWGLDYNSTPYDIQDIDLAIEFQNNPQKTSEKYYKQYIRISSKIKTIDKEENKLILEYTDPDGKYTLQINCPMAGNLEALNEYKEQQELKVKGTVYKFALKTDEQSNAVYLNDCFAE